MIEIKRYDINWRMESIDERPQGDWVKWEDVESLLQSLGRIQGSLDRAQESCERLDKLISKRPL